MNDTASAATPARTLPATGIALLIGITLAWGLNWPLLKLGLQSLPPFTFRALMIPAAAAVLFALARAKGDSLAVPREFRWPLVASSLLNVAGWHALIAFGVSHMASGRAAVVAFTMPLWAAIFSRLFLGERFGARTLIALALGMAGIAVLLSADLAGLRADPLGPIFTVGAAMSWAAGTLVQKQVPWKTPLLVLVAWQMAISSVPIVGCALAFETVPPGAFTPAMFGILAFFVLGPLSYCYAAWYTILRQVPAAVASISVLMVPVVGVIGSVLVVGERVGPSEILALVLVVVSIGLVLIRPKRP